MQIAIDTSTDTASVALVRDSTVLAELTWRCDQNHSVEVLPRLAYLLEKSKLDIQSATCIVVARGPGSYNGLRVGVSMAKGLAFSLGVPLIGISTLEAAAYQHAATGLPVCAISDAGRGEIGSAVYQMQGNGWQQILAEHLTTLENLLAQLAGKVVFCGEFVPSIAGQIKDKLGEKAVIPSPAAIVRRAVFLAELGKRRFDAGDTDDPATLQPLYLRRPHITKPKQDWRQNGKLTPGVD
ncbi:MAG: tRNA (adenosine(37)-N6)-threonylcarbamoyltransferase complex dimerization subunit type 1 TsaB [Chloroflexi bacterium]|nr:tRNA (adenosine(37)-N6)-threonylcarbamoyltransferase complex dimerization subunit type 1 TsaB [Chloroflexota bacterium]